MKTNTIVVCIVFLAFGAASYGQNVEHQFGLGAGIYLNQLKEISLSYGISNKTMLLFFADVMYDQTDTDVESQSTLTTTQNTTDTEVAILAGPEIRGYFFSDKRLSPFAGIRSSIGWAHSKEKVESLNWNDKKTFQLNFGLTYGAEYFMRNNFSIYLCMNLFTYSMFRENEESHDQAGGIVTNTTLKRHRLILEQQPALFLRLYF
ncbi:hypothetical protein JXJ21_02480 [candidate division KSB1 bacterium]|nr:hypothetical protein [candidate division KSB1 bacterium]